MSSIESITSGTVASGAGEMQELLARERDQPLDAALQRCLARAYAARGNAVAAAAAQVAAEAIEQGEPRLLYNVATGYLQHGHLAESERWFRTTLMLDPELAIAHQNLAYVLRERGAFDESHRHLHEAYSRQWLYRETAAAPAAQVLLTCAAGLGNVPIQSLFPGSRFSTTKCVVEYARNLDALALPRHDLVFNAIGEPDCLAASHPSLARLLALSGRPVLNRPEAVARTRRDRLPTLLRGIAGVHVPEVVRLYSSPSSTDSASCPVALAGCAADAPLILRPAEAHGGIGVALARSRDDVSRWLKRFGPQASGTPYYATQYHDCRDADGAFRKYRVIFVDRQPFAYHLAISPRWLVHYFSAGMEAAPAKLAEERRFLEDPVAVFGERAWNGVRAIGERLDLDYAGLDCTLTRERSLLVFEANATMLVHAESGTGPLAHKNAAIGAILAAFERMILARAQA